MTPARRGGQCGIAGCPDTEGGLPFRKAKGTGHTDSLPPPPRGAGEQRGDRAHAGHPAPHGALTLINAQSDPGRRCDLPTLAWC